MARNFNRYQYETSPRKLEPDYAPKKNPYKGKPSTAKKTTTKKKTSKKKAVSIKKREQKFMMYLGVAFAIIFAICYRNSKIDEGFAEVQELKEELSQINKENVQMEISIENSLNLSNIEQQAKDLLGMKKLTNKQTVYVDLPKTDYIESAAEEVIIEEEVSFIGKIFSQIDKLFK